MDAIVGDKFVDERRLRPATLEFALQNFPPMIVDLKQGKLKIDVTGTIRGKEVVTVWRPNLIESKLTILRSDFEKCRDIARLVQIPLFISDTRDEIHERIRAHIRIEFGDPLPPLPEPSPCRSA